MRRSRFTESGAFTTASSPTRDLPHMLARSPLILLVALALACDDATAPAPTIAGAWVMVGYVDHGVSAVTTGTADFLPDGTFSIEGTVTFPGEPVDTVSVAGTYRQDRDRVTLTTVDGSGVWQVTEQAATVTLTLLGVTPPTRIILARTAS